MPIYYRDIQQTSGAWDKLRMTIPTASEIDKIITPTGKASRSALTYMNQKLAAWMMGKPVVNDPYQSQWMEHGHENEAGAIRAFEFQTQLKTAKVGFVTTDNGLVGCSPDNLVGDISWCDGQPFGCIGTLEIKSPSPQVQTGYLLADSAIQVALENSLFPKGRAKKNPALSEEEQLAAEVARALDLCSQESVESDYRLQCQTQLWILELDKSYVSAHNPETASIIGEFGRDERLIKLIAAAVAQFNEIMLERRHQLEGKYGPFIRPEALPQRDDSEFHVNPEDIAVIMRETFGDSLR